MSIPRYHRVLVTTDFSKLANAAIPHAFAVASRDGGEVILAHAMERYSLPNPLYAHYSPKKAPTEKELVAAKAKLESQLRDLAKPYAKESRCRAEVRIVDTDAPVHESIVNLARNEDADVLVMSSHGNTGLRGVFLGSVAEKVIRSLDRPILLVRQA